MGNKIERISADEFMNVVNGEYVPVRHISWRGLDVAIKYQLSLPEVADFVKICTSACFDSENGRYAPEAKDAAIRSCIMIFYTNISLPIDIADQYNMIYHSMIIEEIVSNIDMTQFNEILKAVDESIKHLERSSVSFIERQVNDVCTAINDIQSRMSELFGDISKDELHGIVSALSSGVVDEKKIVSEYLKQTK